MNATTSNAAVVGLLLSGGLDSGILLGQLLRSGRRVQPFYVRCGLVWEEAELRAVRAILQAMREVSPLPVREGQGVRARPDSANTDAVSPLVILEMPLADLYGQHWSLSGQNTPDAASPDEAVYLPGRNALLTLKPALWCALHGIEELALGVLASNPFADATNRFFHAFARALEQAVESRLRFTRPLAQLGKKEVMELGRGLPLELTFSCIAPASGLHCGHCNKCAERQHAFHSVGVDDPTQYANRNENTVGGIRD
jgi:7-cyano-7-deazaguanine synthase